MNTDMEPIIGNGSWATGTEGMEETCTFQSTDWITFSSAA